MFSTVHIIDKIYYRLVFGPHLLVCIWSGSPLLYRVILSLICVVREMTTLQNASIVNIITHEDRYKWYLFPRVSSLKKSRQHCSKLHCCGRFAYTSIKTVMNLSKYSAYSIWQCYFNCFISCVLTIHLGFSFVVWYLLLICIFLSRNSSWLYVSLQPDLASASH